MACPACGFTNDLAARFCARCGTSLTPVAARACAHCGAALPVAARFCETCGGAAAQVSGQRKPARAMRSRRHPALWLFAIASVIALVFLIRFVLPAMSPTAPRARLLVFAVQGEEKPGIYLVQEDGRGLTRLTDQSDWMPVWLPDRRHIGFLRRGSDGRFGVHMVIAAGAGQGKILRLPIRALPWAHDERPVWSKDGRWIAFTNGAWETYELSADGSSAAFRGRFPKPVQAIVFAHHSAWSPDGNWIAFATHVQARGLYKVGANGTGLALLRDSGWRPVWSPDGGRVAFGEGGGVEIHVMNADGTAQRRLTDLGAAMGSWSWSPDGRRIAFVTHAGVISIVDVEGGKVSPVTTAYSGGFDPVWSPDGQSLAFWAARAKRTQVEVTLNVIRDDGSGERRLASLGGQDNLSGLSWRPK